MLWKRKRKLSKVKFFQELGHLLPEMNVDIHMYGNEISKQCDGMKFESYNVRVMVHQQLYHRRSDDTGKPHLVIGELSRLKMVP